jgi:hypothetical protein
MCTFSCCDCDMLVGAYQCKMFGFLPVPFTGMSEENDGTFVGKGAPVVSGNEVIGGAGMTGSTVLERISVWVSVDEGIFVGRPEDGGPVGAGCEVTLAVSLGTGTGTAGAAVALSFVPFPLGAGAAGAAVAPASPFALLVLAVYVATDSEIVLPAPSTATCRTTDTVWTTAVTVLFGGGDV